MLFRFRAYECTYALMCLWWGGFGAAWARCADSRPDAPPDPTTLLTAYESTLAPYERMKGTWTNKDYDWKSGETPRWQGVTHEWTVCRDGDRARLFSRETGDKSASQTPFEDVVQRGERWLSVYPDGSVLSKLEVSPDDFPERLGMAPCCPCYGIIFQVWIPEFLRSSKLSVEEDTLEGNEVYVLRGVSKDVEVSLWLDPSLDYAARRIRFDKHGSPSQSRQFDVKRFQERDGAFVVAEATAVYVTGAQPVLSPAVVQKVVDGKRIEVKDQPARDEKGNVIIAPERRYLREIELVSLDFDPEFSDADFKISQSIANGTAVHVQDASHLDYVWEDGEIVPAPDATALAAARDARFHAGSGSRLFWLVLLNAVLLLAVCGGILYRWRASTRFR